VTKLLFRGIVSANRNSHEASDGGEDMKSGVPLFFVVIIVSLSLVPSTLTANALAATFDTNKPVTVKGTITHVTWTNPHVWLYMDVKDANGKVTTWGVNGGAPTTLKGHGWSRDSLRPGDQIVVEGFAAKNGQFLAAAIIPGLNLRRLPRNRNGIRTSDD
jgi:Family of unknown function (DUF6152)